MPELPEVEHICRYLRARLVGAKIRALTHLDWPRALRGITPAALRRDLAGAAIAAVERRAKLVLVGLEDGRTLVFHLKMTGKLWAEPSLRPPDRATRAIFALDPPRPGGARALRFEDQRKFGWIALVPAAERTRLLAPFGPDALCAGVEELAGAYAARRGRVKAVLLDQRVVAGIGNIYADEILFAARVHPAARLEDLSARKIGALARATRAVMVEALARREGEDVPDQKRVGAGLPEIAARLGPRVYQRTGQPCGRCGAKVARIVLGGRATHFCPGCQRL
jgi:formamidopyrimidine-DNA glycosylase